jgi:hypothetical protein
VADFGVDKIAQRARTPNLELDLIEALAHNLRQ